MKRERKKDYVTDVTIKITIALRYAVFLYLSLHTHRYPIKGKRNLALGPSV